MAVMIYRRGNMTQWVWTSQSLEAESLVKISCGTEVVIEDMDAKRRTSRLDTLARNSFACWVKARLVGASLKPISWKTFNTL